MLCPYCSSPRHTLCAAGFNVDVQLSTFDAGANAAESLCGLAAASAQTHLLGNQTTNTNAHTDESVLVVLPVFTNTGLGAFGRSICQAFLPPCYPSEPVATLPVDGRDFIAHPGQVQFVQLPVPNARRVNVLLVGMGTNIETFRKNICGLIGTAIDSAVSGQYAQLVVALSDLTGAQLPGQQIAATVRCRLSTAIVEDKVDKVLRQLTLVANSDQVDGICHGIDIQGPLCSNCTHPRAASVRLSTD